MPEQSPITVRCPECKVVLRIKSAPRPDQVITCPKCGRRHPFSRYVPVRLVKRPEQPRLDPTRLVSTNPEPAKTRPLAYTAPSIRFAGVEYKLRPGRNVVGRKAESSAADIQLPDNSRFMSREHFAINVDQPSGSCSISPVRDVFQPTSVDGRPLVAGQSLPLRHGSRILITPAGAVPIEIIFV